jgi:hypothetical protein
MGLEKRTLHVGTYQIPALYSEGQGPTQVFLNGFCLPVEQYAETILTPLNQRGSVLAMSIAGIDIKGEPPRTVEELISITSAAIETHVPKEYELWGHSYGGMVGMGVLNACPPTAFTFVNIPLKASFSAIGLHARGIGGALGGYLLAEDTTRVKDKILAAYKNWRDIKRFGTALPLIRDATTPNYEGSTVPGRIFLSRHDGLFAPTTSAVREIEALYPHTKVTILKEDSSFVPHHSWPLFNERQARAILLDNHIPASLIGTPLSDDTERPVGPLRQRELRIPLYLAIGAVALAVEKLGSRRRKKREPVRI